MIDPKSGAHCLANSHVVGSLVALLVGIALIAQPALAVTFTWTARDADDDGRGAVLMAKASPGRRVAEHGERLGHGGTGCGFSSTLAKMPAVRRASLTPGKNGRCERTESRKAPRAC